ncbi:hypothetical protein ABT061_26410 [Streptosporangium sp. NPDC002544]|uniref:hypothetical protein n=1 Tax=Streptosporangium sp. NPDC002544 TaxID=3154538 RepID=UPI0033278388
MDDNDFDIRPAGGTFSMVLSARSPYLKSTPQRNGFPVTIKLGSSMSVEEPQLDRTLMVQQIGEIGGQGGGAKDGTRNLLRSLGPSLLATVVIDLAAPVDEKTVKTIWTDRIDAVILGSAGGAARSPITWAGGACGAMGFDCGSASDSRLGEFRQWVAGLEEDDNAALRAFGLDLYELRKRADDGLIHGLVVTASPDDLQKVLKDSRVRWMRMADVFIDR